LFVLEALPSARTVRRLVADHADEIAFVGLSNAERPSAGGVVKQLYEHSRRSGPGIMPYLIVNFGLSDWLTPLAPLTQRLSRSRHVPEATPLKRLCARLGIPTYQVNDVNGAEIAQALRDHAPDLILTYHFDQILSAETINSARLGGVNFHPALLPRHRGAMPEIYALHDGPDSFGMTLHRLVPRIDAGPILAQEAVRLPADVTVTRAALLLHERGRALLDALLDEIARTGAVPAGRSEPPLPYCPMPPRSLLRELRRRGGRLVDVRDLRYALTLSATKG
jgi:folate-dependent phosphoribosylglycinamide formyltransferase PurN